MKLLGRTFGNKKQLLLVAEDEKESKLIDEYLAKTVQNNEGLICAVKGEVRLSDGYGEHYIRLEKI